MQKLEQLFKTLKEDSNLSNDQKREINEKLIEAQKDPQNSTDQILDFGYHLINCAHEFNTQLANRSEQLANNLIARTPTEEEKIAVITVLIEKGFLTDSRRQATVPIIEAHQAQAAKLKAQRQTQNEERQRQRNAPDTQFIEKFNYRQVYPQEFKAWLSSQSDETLLSLLNDFKRQPIRWSQLVGDTYLAISTVENELYRRINSESRKSHTSALQTLTRDIKSGVKSIENSIKRLKNEPDSEKMRNIVS